MSAAAGANASNAREFAAAMSRAPRQEHPALATRTNAEPRRSSKQPQNIIDT